MGINPDVARDPAQPRAALHGARARPRKRSPAFEEARRAIRSRPRRCSTSATSTTAKGGARRRSSSYLALVEARAARRRRLVQPGRHRPRGRAARQRTLRGATGAGIRRPTTRRRSACWPRSSARAHAAACRGAPGRRPRCGVAAGEAVASTRDAATRRSRCSTSRRGSTRARRCRISTWPTCTTWPAARALAMRAEREAVRRAPENELYRRQPATRWKAAAGSAAEARGAPEATGGGVDSGGRGASG